MLPDIWDSEKGSPARAGQLSLPLCCSEAFQSLWTRVRLWGASLRLEAPGSKGPEEE